MMKKEEEEVLQRLEAIEERLDSLESSQTLLSQAYARSRAHGRRGWLRPPMWTFEQHSPHPLKLPASLPPPLPSCPPRIAIVTPSFNQGHFLRATIDSVLGQNYPNLFYHVQDGGSTDDSVDVLKSYDDRISWHSVADHGQADAINRGLEGIDCDVMAYLNSDDTLLPGTLAVAIDSFERQPNVDIIYGHRIFIDYAGMEIGRAVYPAHDSHALKYAGYVPQESMFWRKRVWDKVGPFNNDFQYALDWDFMLRAEAAGFRMVRLPQFLACFRVHDEQKTTKNYERGRMEMQKLRLRSLGRTPSQREMYLETAPYMVRQLIMHWGYRLGLIDQ
jgi:glycosyltransferase involved in cell wall biosynthesis